MTNLLSRKFILAAAILVMGFVALMQGILTAEQFLSTATWIMGIYGAANVGAKLVNP